jgi:hypothetical protein
VSGSDHIIIDVGCGDAAILLAKCSTFLRVHAKLNLTPRSANSDADRMGERRNTMEELVDKMGRDGKELARQTKSRRCLGLTAEWRRLLLYCPLTGSGSGGGGGELEPLEQPKIHMGSGALSTDSDKESAGDLRGEHETGEEKTHLHG